MKLGSIFGKLSNNQRLTEEERITLHECIQFLKDKTLEDLDVSNIIREQQTIIHNAMYSSPEKALMMVRLIETFWNSYGFAPSLLELKQRIKRYAESLGS